MTKHIEGRATLNFQKREVIQSILETWMATPHLRLGQLLMNSLSIKQVETEDKFPPLVKELFYIEDYTLLDLIKQFAAENCKAIKPYITVEISKK